MFRHLLATAIALGGCASVEPTTHPSPPPPVDVDLGRDFESFVDATKAYTSSVALLERVPMAADHRGLRETLQRLADAVEAMPFVERAAAEQGARLMRNDWLQGTVGLRPELTPTLATKRALQYATGVFQLARRDAKIAPLLGASLPELETAVALIDERVALEQQHDRVLSALVKAGDVLAAATQAAARQQASYRRGGAA